MGTTGWSQSAHRQSAQSAAGCHLRCNWDSCFPSLRCFAQLSSGLIQEVVAYKVRTAPTCHSRAQVLKQDVIFP